MKTGECIHLASSFICTHGKHQNFLCPYKKYEKCPSSIIVTEDMEKSWNEKGFVHIAVAVD